jgi:hypothetical protein
VDEEGGHGQNVPSVSTPNRVTGFGFILDTSAILGYAQLRIGVAELLVADAMLAADRRVALHRLFPTRADVVSALLASFHWGGPVVTYEPKAYVGTNGILYGDVLEIEDA